MHPDYIRIYSDILNKKYPHKKEECQPLLNKENLSVLEIIQINRKIFGNTIESAFNQKHKSYDENTILKILQYQKDYHCSNTELAQHFNLSRNTVTRWKKIFAIKL